MSYFIINYIDDRKNVKFIKRLLNEQPKDKNLLTVFQNLLLVPDFDAIVYEATFRVLAVIYSELDRKVYHKQQAEFLKFLLLNEMEEGKKRKFKLSTYVLLNSLTFLLRIESLVHVFVESGGIETYFFSYYFYINFSKNFHYFEQKFK